MAILKKLRQAALWIGPLLVSLLVAGCAGIEPYEPYDYRQDGPKQGLISGPTGEFVIYRKPDEPVADSEAGNRADETAGGEEQKTDSEEEKTKKKSDGQEP